MEFPPSALHYTLLVVYAVLWAAVTPTFGRLRLFAVNERCRWQTWRRFAWGLGLGNAAPIVGLALLMWLPKVDGFWGVAAGASIGLFPAVLPRLLHAFTASNRCLKCYHDRTQAEQVLRRWDKQWFNDLPPLAWPAKWDRLAEVHAAGANNLSAHLIAAVVVALVPLLALVLVICLACPK